MPPCHEPIAGQPRAGHPTPSFVPLALFLLLALSSANFATARPPLLPAEAGDASGTPQQEAREQEESEAAPHGTHSDPPDDGAREGDEELTLPEDPLAGSRRIVALSVEDAVDLALERNLDVRSSVQSLLRARRGIGLAASAFDPLFATHYNMSKFRQPTVDTLSGLGATTRVLVNPFLTQFLDFGVSGLLPTGTTYSLKGADSRSDSPASGFFGINPRNSTSIEASFTQPLLKDFGLDVNLSQTRSARHRDRIAEAQLRAQQESTIAAVIAAYWDLYFAQQDLAVKEQALEEARMLREINEQKLAVGTGKEIDVTSARANIAAQLSGIIDARNGIEGARDTLLDLINYRELLRETGGLPGGQALYDHIAVELSTELDFSPFPVEVDDAIRLALEERPELVQAQEELAIAEIAVTRASRQRLPTLDVGGTWTQRGLEKDISDSVDELFTGSFYDWRLDLTFELPLGNRRARNELFQAEADLASKRLAYQKTENGVRLEVARAVRNIRAAYQTVRTRRLQTRLKSEELEGEKQRLRVGSSTSYDVVQVQNDLLEAQRDELRALVDCAKSIREYQRAVGVLSREHTR